MKLIKRVFAFSMMLCLLWLSLCPTESMAAPNYKGKTQRFLIRISDSYESSGVWVTMRSTSMDGKKGTITFDGTLTRSLLGTKVKINKGVVYEYTISNLKEGGKITLECASSKILPSIPQLYTLYGKIHIDKSKGCDIANIWKIDTLRYNSNVPWNKMNVYFRNN